MNTQAKTSFWGLVLVSSTLMLTGCGQKGDLYQPADTPQQQPAAVLQDKPCKEDECEQP